MLTTNTFGAMALTAVALPLLSLLVREDKEDCDEGQGRYGSKGCQSTVALAVASYLTVRALNACTTIICATVLHKNVVVWAIIAPKFVFELFFVVVSLIAVTLGVLASAAAC